MFSELPDEVQKRARCIKLLIMDVDGVLTDGRIFIRDDGEEIKSFHTLDGHGIKMVQQYGIRTALITGRNAPSVALRAKQLGIDFYYAGIHDKRATYTQLLAQAQLAEHECAFVGDDVVDLPVMVRCGLPVAVANAHDFVQQKAIYITQKQGGAGAVREVCDVLLWAQGHLDTALADYLK